MTSYPSVKDTTSTFLVINGITPIDSALFLRYSSAILAIESELGVNPSGVYSDVRQRLDSIDGYTSKGGFLPTGTIYQHLEYSGTSWDAVDNITLPENSGDERIITLATPTIGSTNLGIYTPISSGTMNSGDITIYTGTAGREGGYAGNLFIGCSSSFSDSAYYNSRNGVKYNGAIEIIAGGQSASNSIAGSIYMESGSGYGLNSKGGNFYLKPGSANTQNDLGKLLICAADLYGQPAFTNKYYPIYVRTDNVDGYYPGIRYNNLSDVWEFKNDGYTENQWIPIGTGTGSGASLPSGSIYQHLEYDGSNWVSVNDITLPSTTSATERTISVPIGNLIIKSGTTPSGASRAGYLYLQASDGYTYPLNATKGGGFGLQSGEGGASSGSGNAGNGGSTEFYASRGGNCTGSGNAGTGGDLYSEAGRGGNSVNGTAGDGGVIDIFSGAGGVSSGIGNGGDAGYYMVETGSGGSAVSGDGGNGGEITLKSSGGGNSDTGSAGDGGALLFEAGVGGNVFGGIAGDGGLVSISSGNAGFDNITGGGGLAGNIEIEAGSTGTHYSTYNDAGCIIISAGNHWGYDGYAGHVQIHGGRAYTTSKGGDLSLFPGEANIEQNIGKILIESGAYYDDLPDPTLTNKYSIYAKTSNIDGYFPGIRFEGNLNKWQYKNNNEPESAWHDLIQTASASNSIIDITWQGSVSDGYLIYTDKYSFGPYLKIANLAKADNYLYSNVIGAAYSETDKVIINGVHSIYCETSAVPGNILYLSPNNYGMATTTVPTLSNNCITIIGKCFSEKSSGIGLCDVLLDIKEPILLE